MKEGMKVGKKEGRKDRKKEGKKEGRKGLSPGAHYSIVKKMVKIKKVLNQFKSIKKQSTS